MTRDEARALFDSAGLTYAVVTPESLRRLRDLMDQRMRSSGLIQGSFRCLSRTPLKRSADTFYAEILCGAFYFKKREAVSFNPDGFIGFAGWADDQNVQPILEGFAAWVEEMAQCAAPRPEAG